MSHQLYERLSNPLHMQELFLHTPNPLLIPTVAPSSNQVILMVLCQLKVIIGHLLTPHLSLIDRSFSFFLKILFQIFLQQVSTIKIAHLFPKLWLVQPSAGGRPDGQLLALSDLKTLFNFPELLFLLLRSQAMLSSLLCR